MQPERLLEQEEMFLIENKHEDQLQGTRMAGVSKTLFRVKHPS